MQGIEVIMTVLILNVLFIFLICKEREEIGIAVKIVADAIAIIYILT